MALTTTVQAGPGLAGQFETRLHVHAGAFKSGVGSNAVMQSLVASLRDQDVRDLAARGAQVGLSLPFTRPLDFRSGGIAPFPFADTLPLRRRSCREGARS